MRYDTFNSFFHPPKLNKIFILLNFSSRKYAICLGKLLIKTTILFKFR